jgi:hypothetical protein
VVPEGSNLAPADLQSAGLPDELENHGRTGRARTGCRCDTGDLVLPEHAHATYHATIRGSRAIVWPGGIEPPISCSQSTCLAARLWPAGGPPRIRTGKPSPCRGVALPVGASSPGAARPGDDRQPGQGFAGACFAREAACLIHWCSTVHLSIRRHVHPAGWCFAWTAGIEPATTGFGDQRSSRLSYVHKSWCK